MNLNNLLVVDDSPFVHKQLKAWLDPDNCAIHSAFDAESALVQVEGLQPRLVLMDVDMPGMNGLEACRRLKTNPATAHTPVIFITADCSTNDKIKAFEMGAIDYITKPFRPEEVRARIRSALRTRAPVVQMPLVDSLTGLWNESYIDRQVPSQLALAKKIKRPLSCTITDIDVMQGIYEAHGRPVAERIIHSLAQLYTGLCRTEDILAHLGGGRFLILQPATGHTDAMDIANAMRFAVEEEALQPDLNGPTVTCSFGVSESHRHWAGSLLEAAEQSVFDARLGGGNRVVSTDDVDASGSYC